MNAVARFTSLTESANLSSLMEFGEGGHRSPTIADFASAKQDLYNAIGDLVIASQEITAEDKDPKGIDIPATAKPRGRRRGSEGVRNVVKAGESLKTKVHSVCLNVSFMVEEDKIRRQKSSGPDLTPQSFLSSSTPHRYVPANPAILVGTGLTVVLGLARISVRGRYRGHRDGTRIQRSRRFSETMRRVRR